MEAELKQFVIDMNAAWMNHRYELLYDYFHPEVGLLPPGASEPFFGVGPMVESYRQFGASGKLHSFEIKECLVRKYGPVAVCLMEFEIEYEMEAQRFREKGLEQYLIDISKSSPKILWRAQMLLDGGADREI
jgi:hypothetical protein